jgi:hypothetical protein
MEMAKKKSDFLNKNIKETHSLGESFMEDFFKKNGGSFITKTEMESFVTKAVEKIHEVLNPRITGLKGSCERLGAQTIQDVLESPIIKDMQDDIQSIKDGKIKNETQKHSEIREIQEEILAIKMKTQKEKENQTIEIVAEVLKQIPKLEIDYERIITEVRNQITNNDLIKTKNENPVALWLINDNSWKKLSGRTKTSTLHKLYKTWALKTNEKQLSIGSFGRYFTPFVSKWYADRNGVWDINTKDIELKIKNFNILETVLREEELPFEWFPMGNDRVVVQLSNKRHNFEVIVDNDQLPYIKDLVVRCPIITINKGIIVCQSKDKTKSKYLHVELAEKAGLDITRNIIIGDKNYSHLYASNLENIPDKKKKKR